MFFSSYRAIIIKGGLRLLFLYLIERHRSVGLNRWSAYLFFLPVSSEISDLRKF